MRIRLFATAYLYLFVFDNSLTAQQTSNLIYGSYWMYFSSGNGGGQYFCKASSSKGPWSVPVKVKTTSITGSIEYDNSIFADDDAIPYMITKSGKPTNRINAAGYCFYYKSR